MGAPFGCERARRRFVTASGVRLHLLEWGRPGAPGLCFLHGSSAHAHWFDRVAPAFAARFHVVALDLRGHGESDWPPVPAYDTRDFAADLLGVSEALGWSRMALVGHSFGGHNAMCFAAWHPDRVAALVLAECRPSVPATRLEAIRGAGRPPRTYPSLGAAVQAFRLFPPETVAERDLLEHVVRMAVVGEEGGWRYRVDPACNGTRRPVDAWPLLPRITAPTLVLCGASSTLEPKTMFERMRDAIPGAELEDVPGACHHMPLDAPDAFTAAIDAFLARRLPAGSRMD